MFLEALSAVADELSYTQDRVANEASLLTATQRVSVQRHARFVDYELKPAVAATTWLQFDVAPGVDAIAHGQAVMATATDGVVVTFETGLGFRDASPPPLANALWNWGGISPYWYDDSKQCLQTGATQMYLLGRGYGFQPGQMLLIETEPESSADPPVRQVVRLLPPGDPGGPWTQEQCDDLFESDVTTGPPYMTCPTPPGALQGPTAVTMIAWQAADQLKVARDLARTKVIGNIANATQGRTMTAEVFAIRPPATGLGDPIVGAAERTDRAPGSLPEYAAMRPRSPIHARERAIDLVEAAGGRFNRAGAAGDHADADAAWRCQHVAACLVVLVLRFVGGGPVRQRLHHRPAGVPNARRELQRQLAERL